MDSDAARIRFVLSILQDVNRDDDHPGGWRTQRDRFGEWTAVAHGQDSCAGLGMWTGWFAGLYLRIKLPTTFTICSHASGASFIRVHSKQVVRIRLGTANFG